MGKRVRLTRKTRPGVISHYNPDPGHPTPRRWKILRSPFLRGRGGVWWASLAIFFLALRLGDILHLGRLEPAFPAGQSSRRDQCTGTGSF